MEEKRKGRANAVERKAIAVVRMKVDRVRGGSKLIFFVVRSGRHNDLAIGSDRTGEMTEDIFDFMTLNR